MGEEGREKEGEKEGDTGAEKGRVRSKDAPRQSPTLQERISCVSGLAKGGRGAGGLLVLTVLIGLAHHQLTQRGPAK